MRRLLRASLAVVVTLAMVLPTVAPALCQVAGTSCEEMSHASTDASVAWSAPDHSMSSSCAAPDCGLVHAAPIAVAERLSVPVDGANIVVAAPASRALPSPTPLTPPPIA